MSGTSSIYKEAVLEAKKLREVAEANAKKALIEAITPKVRNLIEKQLLGESVDEDSDIFSEAADDLAEQSCNEDDLNEGEDCECGTCEKCAKDEELILNKESVNALSSLAEMSDPFADKIDNLNKRILFFKEMSAVGEANSSLKGAKILENLSNKIIAESKKIENEIIRIAEQEKKDFSSRLVELKKVRKEITQMASRKLIKESMSMMEAEDDFAPPGGEEMVQADEMPVEDEGMSEEGDIEIPADLARELLAALEAGMGDDQADGEEMPDMEVEEESMEVDEEEMEEEEMEEGDEAEGEEMVEIDESLLRRELSRLRGSLKETKGAADPKVLDDFGGASVDKEVFVDGDDSDLNVYAEVRKLRKDLQNESRKNRALRNKLNEDSKVITTLKEQLEQLNLFNAKLLYVNKLMTNEGITSRQKKTIIESLDKAQSLREVKLLYKSLSESLVKITKKNRSLNESTLRQAGGASRVTGAGSANEQEDSQMSRWALLAGIGRNTK